MLLPVTNGSSNSTCFSFRSRRLAGEKFLCTFFLEMCKESFRYRVIPIQTIITIGSLSSFCNQSGLSESGKLTANCGLWKIHFFCEITDTTFPLRKAIKNHYSDRVAHRSTGSDKIQIGKGIALHISIFLHIWIYAEKSP